MPVNTVTLVCDACKRPVRLTDPVSGALPACSACAGRLLLPQPAIFACLACGVRSKPALTDPNVRRACPKCTKALSLIPTAEAAPAASPAMAITVVTQAPALFDEPEVTVPGGGSLPPGTQFGHYRIEKELARGGMGIVYVALDPALKRKIALKVMIAGETATDEAVRRFVREARAAGQLRHPNIVAVHDAGEVDGRHFFTMDLIAGKELSELIGAGASLHQQVEIVQTVCLALHHAHEHGIIHRDLKPANIMVTSDGRPVVMDFGLAKDVSSEASFRSMSGVVQGTPSYMSPEQAEGRTAEIDRRTDVYALGVILYELATGRRPFAGNTLFDTIRAVVNDEPQQPRTLAAEVDASLNAVILRCLEKHREARYPTAKDLADDLGRWLAGEAVTAKEQPTAVRLWRQVRNRPKLLGGIAAGAAALVAATISALVFLGDDPLALAQRDIASGDPARLRAAAVTVAAQLGDGTMRASNRPRALALLRTAVASGDAEAERTAGAALAAAGDGAAAGPLLEVALNRQAGIPRRTAALSALTKLGPTAIGIPEAEDAAKRIAAMAPAETDMTFAQAEFAAAIALNRETGSTVVSDVAADPTKPSALRVAAIEAMGDGKIVVIGPAFSRLMHLAGEMDLAISESATNALARQRSREAIFTEYRLGAIGSNAAASVANLNRQVADRNRQMMAMAEAEENGESAENAVKPKVDPAKAVGAHLRSQVLDERLTAAYDLGQIAGPGAVAPLTAALSDTDGGVRRVAARSLVLVATKDPVPWAPIADLLDNADAGIRADAARALGGLEAKEAVPALADHLASEHTASTRVALVEALGRCRDPAALPALRQAWTSAGTAAQSDLALACVAAFAADKAFAGAAVPDLIAALDHPSRAVREAAGTALANATGTSLGTDAARWKAWQAKQH